MNEIIRVENLVKTYELQIRRGGVMGTLKDLFNQNYSTKIAVDNISFSVKKGEILGFLGQNGAGKSTTIKMLVGILAPSSGMVSVNGLNPHEDRIKNSKNIGVVFGQRSQLWWDIPVSDSFDLLKHMYKIPESNYKNNLHLFSDILDIDEYWNIPVRQLSLGQRMKVELCASLIHSPELIFLDEPTIGLDVVAKNNIRQFIKDINREKETTIILTTHDMMDIEKLCERVMVIEKGKIIYDGSLENLRSELGNIETMTVETEGLFVEEMQLKELEGINEMDVNGNNLLLKYDSNTLNSTMILNAITKKNKIVDFSVSKTSVEDIIEQVFRRTGNDQ